MKPNHRPPPISSELSESDLCKRAFVLAIKDALNVVSGKWKLVIICSLLSGPKSFTEITKLVKEITPRMLSRDLSELQLNDVVMHFEDEAGNAKYQLTRSGQALEEVVIMLATWGQKHRELVTAV